MKRLRTVTVVVNYFTLLICLNSRIFHLFSFRVPYVKTSLALSSTASPMSKELLMIPANWSTKEGANENSKRGFGTIKQKKIETLFNLNHQELIFWELLAKFHGTLGFPGGVVGNHWYNRRATLCGSTFCEARLCEATFCGSTFCEATLCEATFCGSTFCEARLCEETLCGQSDFLSNSISYCCQK